MCAGYLKHGDIILCMHFNDFLNSLILLMILPVY